MADQSSSQDRNLPASQRKLTKAREEGQVARSRDFGHFIAIGTCGALLVAFAPLVADWLQQMTGMQPLETGTAMIALSRALELPAAQALVMEGDAARIERFFATSLQGGAGATTVPQAVEPGKSVTRASADSRRATLAGLLKADLQAFQRGRH